MISCVFVGPTLSVKDVETELAAVCLPPVSQGDVYRAARLGPRAIGIIDGYFDRVPAVWHKEILWAMAQGIHVYGSASMGALRAAELEPFGMVGVGAIFEGYRDGTLEDDDEVAVAHGLAESEYRSQSEALVNIRSTLARAEREGVLTADTRIALEHLAKEFFYPERTYPLILRRGAEQGLPEAELAALRTWLPHGQVNQKREDSLAMLRVMRRELADNQEPKRIAYKLEHTLFCERAMQGAAESEVADPGRAGALLTGDAVLNELRLQGAPYLQTLTKAQLRHLALRDAQRHGHEATSQSVGERLEAFCRACGVQQPEELNRWLQANQLTRARLDALMRNEALLKHVLSTPISPSVLLDQLWVEGRCGTLRARAADKQQRLEAAGLQNASLESQGLSVEALLRWYFRGLGHPDVPDDWRRHAVAHGFGKADSFLRAVLREYCYATLVGQDQGRTAEVAERP